jgi:signal transduction histidine kinase
MQLLPSNQATYKAGGRSSEEASGDSARALQECVCSAETAAAPQFCLLDETGTLVAVNAAWHEHAEANPLTPCQATRGANYLVLSDALTGPAAEDARAFATGIRAVLRGEREAFALAYASQPPIEQRQFVGRVTTLASDGPGLLAVTFEDVTSRTWLEEALNKTIDVAEAAQQKLEAAQFAEEKRRQEAERRRQIAECMRDMLSILNSNQPLDEVLNYVVSQARRLLGSQGIAVYYAPLESGAVSIQAARGLSAAYLASVRREGSQADTLLTPWPVTIPDIAAVDPSLDDPSLEVQDLMLLAPPAEEYRALLAVPILIKDEIYGRLRFYYRTPRDFSDEDAELAIFFSEQVALAIENARLREQVKQAAVVDERNRLARDLHDAVTQTIFSANLMAEALPRIWKHRPEEGWRGLEELHRLIQGALAELRTLLLELRPAAIIEKKFGDLLKQLVATVASQTQLVITFTAEGDRTLPPDVQIALYRIAQEALNNSSQHAKATHININLQCQAEAVAVRISDNGCGFHPSAIRPDQLGVSIMRERALNVGATFELTSCPGHGTSITIIWSPSAGRGSHG